MGNSTCTYNIVVTEHHPQSEFYLFPFTSFLFLLATQRALAGNVSTPSWKTALGECSVSKFGRT
jgi:hypothetical protein